MVLVVAAAKEILCGKGGYAAEYGLAFVGVARTEFLKAKSTLQTRISASAVSCGSLLVPSTCPQTVLSLPFCNL